MFEETIRWRLVWTVSPSFRASFGVKIDCSEGDPEKARIWVVPNRPLEGSLAGLQDSGERLFEGVRPQPLGRELHDRLLKRILSLRIGFGPQPPMGFDGSTTDLDLEVNALRLQFSWWNEPEDAQARLQGLIRLLRPLVKVRRKGGTFRPTHGL